MADTTLRDAVLESFAEAEKAAGAGAGEDPKTEKVEKTDKAEDKKPEEKPEKVVEEEDDDVLEVDASSDDIKTSLAILRALRDPKTSADTIEFLAKQAGYNLENKKEVKQLEKDFKTILKEDLGDSYEFIGGDKFAVAIEKAFKSALSGEIESRTKPVIERLSQAEAQANQQKADTAMDAMWKRNEVTDPKVREKIAGQMLRKMAAMPAGPESNIDIYLDDIYALVTKDRRDATTVKKTITKVRNNAQDVERRQGEGSDDDARIIKGSKLPSVREAVEAAFRNERLE